jgi:pimeloyl-ACP methyl ester carboxylesterase
MSSIRVSDHRVPGVDGTTLAVRELVPVGGTIGVPLVLIHGARAGGVASFDLAVAGGSLARDLVETGRAVYVMDARGYGASSRPVEMSEPADAHGPIVRSVNVVNDIDAVVDWISTRRGTPMVSLLGWATGGHWAGFYASLHPEKVHQLVIYNALYGGSADHPSLGSGSGLEDPEHPGQFDRRGTGAWRTSDAASLLRTWDNSIEGDDLDVWRDPAVAAAYVETAMTASGGDGPFTHPAGALEDSFYLAIGRQFWDASFVRAHTLVIRSERDFWSRPADVDVLAAHLIDAASITTVTIPDATHFVHLDRPEHGRQRFLDEVSEFLRETD